MDNLSYLTGKFDQSYYIVATSAVVLLSLISEDNNCVSVLYPISSPSGVPLLWKEWHCCSVTLTGMYLLLLTSPQQRLPDWADDTKGFLAP